MRTTTPSRNVVVKPGISAATPLPVPQASACANAARTSIASARTFLSRSPRTFFFFLILSLLLPLHASAQQLRVAAAADLQFALTDLATQYEKQSGTKLAITYGSSGNFFAQIQNGAPFDIFFSADTEYPKKLIAGGLADADSFRIYAQGYLVVWLPPDSPIDLAANGYRALLDPRIKKIAIANPEHAPYGRAAIVALRDAAIYDQIKEKLVFGENVSQAAQFVESGSADAGIIPRSLALSPAMKSGKRYELVKGFSPILQGLVLIKASSNKAAAKNFLEFLQTTAAQEIFTKYGLAVPPAPPAFLTQ
jgi:molybdate transport system substrate-binding protein